MAIRSNNFNGGTVASASWRISIALLLAALLAVMASTSRAQSTATLIEYYHAGFDHYFVTSIPNEIAQLDNGTLAGWTRTNQQITAYALGEAGSAANCRFFSTAFGLKSSHFYTPYDWECATVQSGSTWQFEAYVFGVKLPDIAGNCPAGTIRVYRLYNNGQGGAPNHRYTTDLNTRSTMIAKGWIPEGAGTIGVIGCVPAPAPAKPDGFWYGTTSTNSTVIGIVLDTNVFYFLYTIPNSNVVGGVIQGNVASAGAGIFTSSNAKDFSFSGQGVYNATISGNYTPRSSVSGVAASAIGSASFSLAYQSIYEQPASFAATAGTYAGTGLTSIGTQPVTMVISTSGAIVGSAPGCSFTGTATPHGAVNIFDVSIRFGGGLCLFGTATLIGVAYFDAADKTIYAVAPNASRTDGFLFIGAKP